MEWSMELTTETIRLNNNAVTQPSTVNFGPTILEAQTTINALMTKRNKPNVIMVTGIVRMIRIGFTIALSNARTRATITIVFASSAKWTPGKMYAATHTASAVTRTLMMNPIKIHF